MRTRTVLISGLLALPATYAASATDWQSRTIYQLVTDRFATSDGSSPSCDTSARKYCGGTYKGIINKLDYIQNMGFDAVWISPIAKNVEGETAYGEAFHGYWTEDPSTLNSHFGSEDDLKALSDELHKRKMYLMVDVVINHLVATQTPPQFSSFPSPFNSDSSFHPQHFIQSTDYPTPPFSAGNQTAVEQGWLGDEKLPLVDINTEDQNLQNWWYDWIKNLVSKYSIDGVRIDTVKHIRQDFWTGFSNAAGVWSVGEVLANATEYVGPYTKFLPAVLDYPTWFPLINGFMTPDGNLTALAETYTTTQNTYGNGGFSGHVIASFLENHDQPRFGGQTKDLSLVKNAMAWVFTQDGVPILYYGQEQGYQGGEDPANREALWLSGYDESKPLVKHTQALNAARKAAASANPKFHDTPLKFLPTESKSSLVVSKAPLLALFSNGGTSSNPSWTVSNAGYSANQDLVDVVSCTKITADGSGGVTASSKQGLPMVLVPASSLPKGGNVCSDLATGNQSSGAARSAFASVAGALGVVAFAWQFLL